MDNCYIESESIIADETVSIWAGVRMKKVKGISPELLEGEVMRIANNYLGYSGWFI